MEKPLKIGVIGCGEIAQTMHLPVLSDLPCYEVAAICDISEYVLNHVGDKYGIKNRYLDYRDLVNQSDLDAVLVTTHEHAAPTLAALSHGKHVLTEKPIAFNLNQADQMILAAKETQKTLMVAYNRRFDPGFEWVLSHLETINDPAFVRVHDFGGSFNPINEMYQVYKRVDISREMIQKAKEQSKREAIEALGPERAHLSDLYLSLVLLCSHDSNILHEAYGKPVRILHVEAQENWFVFALLELANGAICSWETGLLTGLPDWDQHLSVYNDQYRIDLDFNFPYNKNFPTGVRMKQFDQDGYVEKHIKKSVQSSFKREWQHFYDCVVNQREPVTSGEKGRQDLEFLIGLIRSIEEFRPKF